MKKIYIILLLLFTQTTCPIAVNLAGFVQYSEGLGQVTLSFIHCLHNGVKINLFNTRPSYTNDIPEYAKAVIKNSIENQQYGNPSKYTNNVTIYTSLLMNIHFAQYLEISPNFTNKNSIKFAYSMVEGTKVPQDWIENLNNHFDALIVPDECLVGVYKNSGATVPIFVLPMSLNLSDCLSIPLKKKKSEKFIFGFCGGFGESKNHEVLIKAFLEEFKNEPNVFLKLHGSNGYLLNVIKNKVEQSKSKNIILTTHSLTRKDYIKFISHLDCYITLSRGEGFSITPREAMAAGVPCIVTNNTAQKTICKSGFVYSVPSNTNKPHTTGLKTIVGYDFHCKIEDARKAMRDVYENYQKYLNASKHAREWVKQYLPANLKQRYSNIISPKNIFLGSHNLITKDYLMTNSKSLFYKYKNKRA